MDVSTLLATFFRQQQKENAPSLLERDHRKSRYLLFRFRMVADTAYARIGIVRTTDQARIFHIAHRWVLGKEVCTMPQLSQKGAGLIGLQSDWIRQNGEYGTKEGLELSHEPCVSIRQMLTTWLDAALAYRILGQPDPESDEKDCPICMKGKNVNRSIRKLRIKSLKLARGEREQKWLS